MMFTQLEEPSKGQLGNPSQPELESQEPYPAGSLGDILTTLIAELDEQLGDTQHRHYTEIQQLRDELHTALVASTHNQTLLTTKPSADELKTISAEHNLSLIATRAIQERQQLLQAQEQTVAATQEAQNAVVEKKFGTYRVDAWRRNVVLEYLDRGIPGTVIQVDLAGLHTINKYGAEVGDEAISQAAGFLKSVVSKFNAETALPIVGRKGDEVYAFIPHALPEKVASTLLKLYANRSEEEKNITVTAGESKKNVSVVLYSRIAYVDDPRKFDRSMVELERSLENAKVETMQKFAAKLEKDLQLSDLAKAVDNWTELLGIPPEYKHLSEDEWREKLQKELPEILKSFNLPLIVTHEYIARKRIPDKIIDIHTQEFLKMVLKRLEAINAILLKQSFSRLIRRIFLGERKISAISQELSDRVKVSTLTEYLELKTNFVAKAIAEQVTDYILEQVTTTEENPSSIVLQVS